VRRAPTIALLDEYQDGLSAGSLVKARGCWLHLLAAEALHCRQRFTFVFQSPTERMALGLTDFLRYAAYAGFVRVADRAGIPGRDLWRVAGTTHATIWALPDLEHLFMDLRGAGTRYGSTLVMLDLVPSSHGRESARTLENR
jgi:hypothetical protein